MTNNKSIHNIIILKDKICKLMILNSKTNFKTLWFKKTFKVNKKITWNYWTNKKYNNLSAWLFKIIFYSGHSEN